ncbi:MAG: hypothetical protein FJY85_13845, partial [Deltaproteobacteria bacterium]|nr:hypothetical protein [Deltaproteobacteria bacterium]
MEKEAEQRLERFVAHILKQVGELSEARALSVTVWDSHDGKMVIHGSSSREGGSWRFAVQTDQQSYHRLSSRPRVGHSPFVLKSQFWYQLDLPHRWKGALSIEYPGICFLPDRKASHVKRAIGELSKDLTIQLANCEMAHMRRLLTEERRFSDRLRELSASLSKELYCLSSISNALVQSHKVEQVLTRVIEHILHLLSARFGVVYFPGNRECVALKLPRSGFGRDACPWFRRYYENARYQPGNLDESCALLVRQVGDHSLLPGKLKKFLAAEKVESVVEFSLQHHEEVVGRGMLGFQEASPAPAVTRLLVIALNMVGLFLERMNLMEDLERQVKLLSQRIAKRKKERFLTDWGIDPPVWTAARNNRLEDLLLEEIERSRSMALLGRLASGVAHQIRNPLSNLVYGLHLLRQEGVSEDEKKGLIEAVTERVETMNRMINDFIQYTRIPEPRLGLESINQLLSNALHSFKGWMDLAHIESFTFFDDDLPLARVDAFL